MIGDFIVIAILVGSIIGLIIGAAIIGLKTPKYIPTRREKYNKYIHSNKWRRRRVRALILGGHKCALCNSREELQVHHLSYEHLGKERDYELQVLCHSCHQDVHGRKF